MTDLLLTTGVNNLLLSLALALVAWAVQARGKRPFVAHLLWLLVLVKLVTPPLLNLPMVAFPGLSATTAEAFLAPASGEAAASLGSMDPAVAASQPGWISLLAAVSSPELYKQGLGLLWLLGSACVLVWSLVRVYRFQRLLAEASRPAARDLQDLARAISKRLGLSTTPTIYSTSAHLSPMVWWIGGKVRVLIPDSLPAQLAPQDLRWILAHELAHVRRRDHLVRWLEWLACVLFWWNPVAWWARRSLRAAEEVCCDALVLSHLKPNPRSYASSLLSVVEFLASPVIRPPAMASQINSGGFLERRLRMILSDKPLLATPRWLQVMLLLLAVGLLPLGVARGQDDMRPEAKKVWAELQAAVEAGQITQAQARERFAGWQKAQTQRGGDGEKGDLVQIRVDEVLTHFDKDSDGALTKAEAGDFWEQIVAADANKDGKVTGKEMHAAWSKKVQRGGGEPDPARVRVGRVMQGYDTDKDGVVTQAEAGDLWERISSADADKNGAVTAKEMYVAWSKAAAKKKADPETVIKEIQAAVESGRITPEQGKQRIEAYKKRLAEEKAVKARLEAAALRIKIAVDEGKITPEQGKARLEALKQRLTPKPDERGREDPKAVIQRIKAAIESGRITPEEGKARIEAYKKSLDEGARKEARRTR